eukprot:344517-Chlamydomonas_euryale.AAC.10
MPPLGQCERVLTCKFCQAGNTLDNPAPQSICHLMELSQVNLPVGPPSSVHVTAVTLSEGQAEARARAEPEHWAQQ